MSIQRITFAKTGMAALALAFIMVMAGCPIEDSSEPGPGADTALTGAVSITGFAKVGGTLTADTSGLVGSGTISYVWKQGDSSTEVNGEISGASGDTYTPATADLGKYLSVTVSRAGHTGSITSPATAKVLGADAVEPVVSGVRVTAAADAEKGGTLQFYAVVTGTGGASSAVVWSITTGGVKTGTAITENGGLLTVAADETLAGLTIRAVSTLDRSKYGEAVVTVIEARPRIPLAALSEHIDGLPENTAASPHTVKLDMVNISINGVMGSINTAVTNRYIIVDLSACYATNQTISGAGYPGPSDMNYIKNNQYIVGVILPGELTIIGEGTFFMCSSLASVTIPGGVTSIRDYAFSGCDNLRFTVTGAGSYSTLENSKMLIRNNNVENGSFGEDDFDGIRYASDNIRLVAYPSASGAVTLPGSITSIGKRAFSGCSSLASVTIPASVTSIERGTFSRCSGLVSVIISEGVTSIGDYAFSGGSRLASVTIPASVTSIGQQAFYRCSSLTSVTIPSSVTFIDASAFVGCVNLRFTVTGASSYSTLENGNMLIKNGNELAAYPSASGAVTLPEGVTSIGDAAFHLCSSLESVTIPEGVTSIKDSAFSGCSSLASVTIPGSVTSIGDAAFWGCSSLTSVTFAPGSNISSSGFSSSSPFLGDLRAKYLAWGGGPGTYTATRQSGDNQFAVWTKQ